ncbi:putative peptidoglycan-binding domain-containing protein [Desulfitobacterium dichloroeliminans LMG P-21439]|uniref:Putative peptidoglycan-binding domain-containing protein n=1 Tax=Desulfitobacterium dichloroeliminans (strain LMG P-21439 / DCA1) TaxID=871963 RepID=L0F3N0_DESDL|nr:LysM peptidoglycan-binding domain-containing protein [Desulfitobacterium dichloroeliminans]AGA67670.1 putative peptidoglycan-binding domain-containing protein [Desulfitobacterium dichloroeliminans LMG P-21439]
MTYIVQPGDTLYLIAQQFNTTVDAIVALNSQITNPNLIFPGQLINIPGPASFCPLLHQGDRGPGVTRLQQLLSFAGFNPGPIDGIFGPRTQSALNAFQFSQKELERTGVADPETWSALGAACQPRSEVVTYVIRPSDTLFIIAIRYNVTVESLLRINPLITDPNFLRVGQAINIPPNA